MAIKYTNDQIIDIFKKTHGEKYCYDKVIYTGKHNKIIIICKIHGQFEQSANSHSRGQGCSKCSKRYMDTDYFIHKANIIQKFQYDYSKTKFIHSKKKVVITCLKHGDFLQTPYDHINGSGCFKCYGSNKKNTNDFILKSTKTHGNLYDYTKSEYVGVDHKIIIICKIHGEFSQKSSHHIRGAGCPKCRESKGERIIRKFLTTNNIKFKSQHVFQNCRYKKPLKFDFYLTDHNICIEFDGVQHFSNVSFGGKNDFNKITLRDSIKNNYCKNNNIVLFRISYKKINDINHILSDFLSNIILTRSSKIEK